MIEVRTGSRLHFGLFNFAAPETSWPNTLGEPGVPARSYGGVGLMIEAPGVHLQLQPAAEWSAEGPLAQRILAFARRFSAQAPLPPQHFRAAQMPPEHAGLGTGTQLGLAVAAGLARAWSLPDDLPSLVQRVHRGQRSAIGANGFAQGGFLVEAGLAKGETLATLVVRLAVPDCWRVVLIIPAAHQGLSGPEELEAFRDIRGSLARTDALCRLVLLGMVPALLAGDCHDFGEAVFDFNRRVGDAFARVQGGAYALPQAEEWVTFIRREGIPGVGQSSWGPTVFALVPDSDWAEHLTRRLVQTFAFSPAEVLSSPIRNRPATVVEVEAQKPA
jgi:beta-RFAP synthase